MQEGKMSKLEDKASGVMQRVDDLLPRDPELRDAIYDAILMEFEDWETIVGISEENERNIGPIEQEFRARRNMEL